ncbi:hypothetical protein B0A50_08833, partial [Salinomyces thailandicus]
MLSYLKPGDGSITRLSGQDVIAVYSIPPQGSDDYSILYVVKAPDSQQDAPPYIFKSSMGTKLPQAFIDDFQPPDNASWPARQSPGQTIPNLHIVVSIGSGTGQALAVCQKMLKPMLKHVCSPSEENYALHVTTSETTITDLTQNTFLPQANQGIAQTIILLSGDGGIVDIINAILSSERKPTYLKPTIALLPLGTGNALANSANINNDNTMGLRTLLQGTSKDLPLFRVTFSPGTRLLTNHQQDSQPLHQEASLPVTYGAVVCSWGLHASLVAESDTPSYRKFGADRFQMAAKDLLSPPDGSAPHPYHGRLSVLRKTPDSTEDHWHEVDRDAHGYVLATLVNQLEKGFTISPLSTPLDPQLRLIHFGPLSGQAAMEIMTQAYQGGQHVHDDRVGYEAIEGLRVTFTEAEARFRK